MSRDGVFDNLGFATHLIGVGNADVYFMNYIREANSDASKLSRAFHVHACAEIFCCSAESYNVFVNDYKITLNKNDFLIIPGGCSHIKAPDTLAPWDSMLVLLTKRQATDGASLFAPLKELFIDGKLWVIRGDTELVRCFEEVSRFDDSELTPTQFLSAVTFLVRLTEAKRELKDKNEFTLNYSIKDTIDFERLSAVVSQMNKNKLTLSQAAKRMFVSERQLSRYCLKFYGKNYYDITLDIQMRTAAYYLTQTDKRIGEIAELVNMNTTLVRNFNRVYGMTPSQYRKLYRG